MCSSDLPAQLLGGHQPQVPTIADRGHDEDLPDLEMRREERLQFRPVDPAAQLTRGRRWDPVLLEHRPVLGRQHEMATGFEKSGEAADEGCLIGNMALEVTPTSEDVRIKLAAIYREWSAALASCLREAQEKGELSAGKNPEQIAVALIDTFEGAVMRAKVERSRAPFDSFERFVLPSLLT